MSLRSVARTSIENAAVRSGVTTVARALVRRRIAILAWHNVVAPDETGFGDSSLHLPLDAFLRQVELVARTHDVLPLDEALEATPGSRPRAVLTFDDAYRGAVTLALPELKRRGIPATVFVAPALLGAASTWWDDLGAAGALSVSVRDQALSVHAGRADPVRAAFLGMLARRPLPSSFGIATTDELRTYAGDGITLGSHSWGHEHLPSLAEPELRDNLQRTLAWLRDFGLPYSRWLSLPYGAGSGLVCRLALEAGHAGVLRVSGGLLRPTVSRTSGVPRINVPAGLSTHGLELRLTGLVR